MSYFFLTHHSQPSIRLGSGLPYLLPDLGFPEFESVHLTDFSINAQFFKSVASAIPPRPHVELQSVSVHTEPLHLSIPPLSGSYMQLGKQRTGTL